MRTFKDEQFTFLNSASGKKYLFVLPGSFIKKMTKTNLISYITDYIDTALVPLLSQELLNEQQRHLITMNQLETTQQILTAIKRNPKLERAVKQEHEKYRLEMEDDE